MKQQTLNFKPSALLLALGVALGLSACGDKTAGGHPASQADRKEVVVGNAVEPSSLDPHKSSDASAFNILRQVLVGLTTTDAEGKTVPALAESWKTEDGIVWTFHLRDAKWSNGEPITAEDFVYSFRRLTDPETASPYGSYLVDAKVKGAEEIAAGKAKPDSLGVKALDDKTLQITLTEPVPYLHDLLVLPVTYAVNKKAIEEFGDKWTQPEHFISSGAYQLKEWVVNSHIVAERNPNYYDANHVKLDKVTFLPLVGNNEITRYQAGEVDVTYGVPVEQYHKLKEELGEQVVSSPRLCVSYYEFNNAKAPFDNPKVRRALSIALDRETITQKVLGRGEEPSYQFTPASTQGMQKVTPEWATWDQAKRVEEAKKLLNEAGFNEKNPLTFELLYSTSEAAKRQVTATAALWNQALGFVTINPINQEWKTSLETRRSGKFEVAYAAWCADYNEPSSFLNMLKGNSGNNSGKYKNAKYDETLDATLKAGVTPEQRTQLYLEAEKILDQDMPNAFVYDWVNVRLVNPNLVGYSTKDPVNNYYVKDWSFK